jgi:hypothetical protein
MNVKRVLLAIGASAFTLAIGVGTASADDSSGQAQQVDQGALTLQASSAEATADQNAVNANVPVTVAGGSTYGGTSSATQDAANAASATSTNDATTDQTAIAAQTGGTSDCKIGCGGAGQAQQIDQQAATIQKAASDADADQNAVNANVPVTVAGGSVKGGSSSADQTALNVAKASSSNDSTTDQTAIGKQIGGDSHCKIGCGGAGQAQQIDQSSLTVQKAKAESTAKQKAVNANAGASIAGKWAFAGSSSAKQGAFNFAGAKSSNEASTKQHAFAFQKGRASHCKIGCGGRGQAQLVSQGALTFQGAFSHAKSHQKAVNTNAPATTAGKCAYGGSSWAGQLSLNGAWASSDNDAWTKQLGVAHQA